MVKSGKVLWLLGIAFCLILRASTGFAYYPPDPTLTFYGDADGDEYVMAVDVPIHETQANEGYTLAYNTLQPNNDDDRWNTCDVDGDGY